MHAHVPGAHKAKVQDAEESLQIAKAGKDQAEKAIAELKKRKHSEIESPMPDKS